MRSSRAVTREQTDTADTATLLGNFWNCLL